MAPAILSRLQKLWPFSVPKPDDLKLSNESVQQLSLPEQTKKFIFAAKIPNSNAVVYILAVQNLSKQSAIDAEQLIKEVQPNAVVCLVASSALTELLEEEKGLLDDKETNVPTSNFGVLKKCLLEKINKDQYDKFARFQVLREIFGVGLYGHFLAAKKAAEEVGSQFILLESPYESTSSKQLPNNVNDSPRKELVNPLLSFLKSLYKEMSSDCDSKKMQDNYKAPQFARSIYPLLADLHDIFNIIPAIENALTSAQKMLSSVNKGELVDTKVLSQVHNFRIAIEALRITLNEAARHPTKEQKNSSILEFSQISSEETSSAISVQGLKSLAIKFGSLVAIVDASKLAGLRRHWTTPVPPDVAELSDQCFTHYLINDHNSEINDTTGLTNNPLVAAGAGATAALRATALVKTVPIYALIKLATFEIPSSLRTAANGFCKMPCASPGAKPSILNLPASGEIIRAMAYSVIALAERTGLLAMQTSFYEIMRQRRGPLGRLAPWATFFGSVGMCSGLMMYKDGIECAAQSVPLVPTIASMGRGLERLQQASEEVKRRSGMTVQEGMQSLMNNLKKIKVQ